MKLPIIRLILFIYILVPAVLYGQSQSKNIVQGTISTPNGETLPGANVVERDSEQRIVSSTITDINGHFVLKIKNPSNKLVISFVGFKPQSLDIGNKKTFDVVLEEKTETISEVVVTGQKSHDDGTFAIPKREISTAVQSLDAKSLEGIQVTSVDEALQGRIAGFDIVANSGDLGAGTSMRIRGTSSINANTQPLIVVNNIPYEVEVDPSFDFSSANQEQYANMLSINPDDIEDITVLKDASATAIWGSKGANGVLSIKTKKGAVGNTRVQYSYRLTGAVQPPGLNMLDGDEYTMLMKQAYFNQEQDEEAANIRELLYDPSFSEYQNFNNNTNWFNEVTQTGMKHDHYLNVSGGGERATFRISGGYLKETGTIIGQQLDRISSRAYLDYNVSDRMKFITELSFTYTDHDRNWTADRHSDPNHNDELGLLTIAYRKMPNVSVYQQDLEGKSTGDFYNISNNSELPPGQRDLRNPVALANLATDNLKNFRIQPTFRLQYDLLDPEVQILKYSMYVSFDVNNDKISKFLPREVSNYAWDNDAINQAESSDSESMTVMADNNITWEPKLNNPYHDLTLYGSVQIRSGNRATQKIGTTNLPSGALTDASTEGYLYDIWSQPYPYRSNAILGRVHYAYKGRYILGATFRRDGSTKFGDEYKYGNFPGISAKWIISDEPFMSSFSNWLSLLAFRPSWGISGNEPDDEFLHFSRYEPYSTYIDLPATRPTTLRLSDLRWEKSTSLNYGVDLWLFNERILMDINFYNKRTEDLLFENLDIPSTSGYTTVPWQNVGVMDNNGWELNFSTNRLIKIGNFQWDFNFNMSNYINTIVELRDDVLAQYNNDFGYANGTYLTRIQEGHSYGSIYGFRYKGVYQYNDYIPGEQENAPVARDENGNVLTDEEGEPLPMHFAYGRSNEYEFKGGDAIYEDINNDGNIDELDIVYLGNSNPEFNGGFGSTIRYKKFSCTVFFNFRYGNDIVNYARMHAENMYSANNQSKSVNWRWRKDGDITEMPRALNTAGYNWLGSDRYVEDGSFLRMKYLTFNYSLPQSLLKKIKLQRLSLYLTINNLFVWTKYTGVDPEIGYDDFGVSGDWANTPRSKDATLGISVTF